MVEEICDMRESLGGLSLPRKSVVRLTDRPDMTLDVYRGRKTTIQPTNRERERERERDRECVCACVPFYNTKLWTQFYISGLTWEQGWLRSVCASSKFDQTLLFFAYHLSWVYIPKTHTGLQKIQKKYQATSCGGVI